MIPDDVIIRAGTKLFAHTDMVPLEYVRQALAEAREKALQEAAATAHFIAVDQRIHRLTANGALLAKKAILRTIESDNALRGE